MAIYISWLPQERVPYLPILFAPPKSIEKISADTARIVSRTESARADTLREINSDVIRADLTRQVAYSEIIRADTLSKIFTRDESHADTKIVVGISEEFSADTFLQVGCAESVHADLARSLPEFSRADFKRKIVRVEKTPADLIIRLPHVLNYIINQNLFSRGKFLTAAPSLINTFKDYGVTEINITLNEKTLSDDFRFGICRQMEINDLVQGTLLDYHFNFLVEETSQTELVQTVKGRYNQDDLLYTWFNLTPDSQNPAPKAKEIISRIAFYFGLASDVRIDDFAPDNLSYDTTITYSDLLQSVFGWTSRVPQNQINVFIRGGTLHCIQRSKENSVFDITNLPHSRPTINKKFNRVLCHNPNNDNDDDSDDDSDDEEYKFNGTVSYSENGTAPFQARIYIAYTYKNGLLVREQYSTNTGLFESNEGELKTILNQSSTSYFYTSLKDENSDKSAYYISHKENTTKTVEQIWNQNIYNGIDETNETIQNISTSYNYKTSDKEIYLFHEHEQNVTVERSEGEKNTEKTWADTYHVPVGNGWYAQTVYRNGIFQGANLSQGKPGNAVSPYTVEQAQNSFKGFDTGYSPPAANEKDDNELSFIIDTSFPVIGTNFKQKLNEDLRWLHRKIEETISVDLISPVQNGVPDINHIVDFTERVRFNGNEYYLQSNRISFTPRKFIQSLQLIRWY